ncbi:MAG: hypothetical protein ACPGWR_32745 [Ardenticatenaceae bacterium]
MFFQRTDLTDSSLVRSLVASLTGEARIFRLDEVRNCKKMIVIGAPVARLTPTDQCFFNVFSMVCRGLGMGLIVDWSWVGHWLDH